MTQICHPCLVLILLCGIFKQHEVSAKVLTKRFAVDTSSLSDPVMDGPDDNGDDFLDGYEKRASKNRFDDFMDYTNTLKRFSLVGTDLGKRSFRSDLGKRGPFPLDLGKRSEMMETPLSPAAELMDDLETIKRLSGNMGFRSDLGKRAEYVMPDLQGSLYDAYDNTDSAYDKRAFRSDLGKRASFRSDLGKRASFRSDLGKRASFRSDLGKRYYDDAIEAFIRKRPSYRIDLGKRASFRSDLGKRASFRSDLGKRAFRSDLGKRDIDLGKLSLDE